MYLWCDSVFIPKNFWESKNLVKTLFNSSSMSEIYQLYPSIFFSFWPEIRKWLAHFKLQQINSQLIKNKICIIVSFSFTRTLHCTVKPFRVVKCLSNFGSVFFTSFCISKKNYVRKCTVFNYRQNKHWKLYLLFTDKYH